MVFCSTCHSHQGGSKEAPDTHQLNVLARPLLRPRAEVDSAPPTTGSAPRRQRSKMVRRALVTCVSPPFNKTQPPTTARTAPCLRLQRQPFNLDVAEWWCRSQHQSRTTRASLDSHVALDPHNHQEQARRCRSTSAGAFESYIARSVRASLRRGKCVLTGLRMSEGYDGYNATTAVDLVGYAIPFTHWREGGTLSRAGRRDGEV